MFGYVLRQLRAAKGQALQRQIAADSGVPYSTLCKIAQRRISNPGVAHVQALFDYFKSRESGVCPQPPSGWPADTSEAA